MTATDPFMVDPFSTVVRLALLPFMPEETKIGICDNSIVFFQTSYTSWLLRNVWSLTKQGCSRHDLHHLRAPIERANSWYRTKAPEVLKSAAEGLRRLARVYRNHGNVRETICSMIKLLEEEEPGELELDPQIASLRNAWDDNEIGAVKQLFVLLKSQSSEYIVGAIKQFITGKEPKLLEIIRQPKA